MSATCFPFGSPERIDVQLAELREKTDGTLRGALVFADADLDKQMAEFRLAQDAIKFEEWWRRLKPAEVDEFKEIFKECWDISRRLER